VASLGMGGIGSGGPAVRAAGSMGDWDQARDGAIGAHIDAGGRSTDATEAGIGGDRWASTHATHGYGKGAESGMAMPIRNAPLGGQNGY